jgi:molecular chaperone DnaK (HSP70)
MAGRVAIDFGTSNTVVAVWDDDRKEGVPVHLPDLSRAIAYRRGEESGERISYAPSLIHYAADDRRWIGAQVLAHDLYDSNRTCRWMKRYVARRSPVRTQIGEASISYAQAAGDFLAAILAAARAQLNLGDEEIAFTAPVEAFEHYENWLADVADAAGFPRFRLIDEPSAAALGYGVAIQPNDIYLVFDFGGGTLDVSIVLIDEPAHHGSGRRCRVLGKAGADAGGATIDGWLFQEVLRQAGRSDADEAIRPLSRKILALCERAKEQLSLTDEATVTVTDAAVEVKAVLSRSLLESLFDAHGAYTQIDQTIRRALNSARDRGYDEGQIKAVLLVGGSSLIPSVQQQIRRIFGRERVFLNRPLDAVARGGAAFIAGIEFYDHIQHDYAFRFVDPAKGNHDYRTIVPRGTPYPTKEPIARMTIKASHDGQTQLGIAIFEMGDRRSSGGAMELTFDPQGAARLRRATPEDVERQQYFWINETSPTFLNAQPPASKGEPRFEVEFGIDANKRLLITARDLKQNRVVLRNHAVVKLT